jgi:hemolysin D
MSELPALLDRLLGKHRPAHEYEFLPAALEIVETPPSPAGRAAMLLMMAFIAIALVWACLGHLDIIATAEGRIIPTGKVKTIQPFETGVVKAIAVHDGQHVAAGDLLVEMDPTIDKAELGHVASEMMGARIEAARLSALENGADDLVAPEGADPADVDTARRLMHAQAAEQQAKLDSLARQVEQKQAEADGAKASIAKVQAALPMVEKRRDIRKYLSDNEYGSKLTYLESQQDVTDQQSELKVQQHKLEEATAAIAGLKQQIEQTAAEFHRANLDKLSEDEAKIASLGQDVAKDTERTNLQRLTSPVDGTVQQLAVHTVGGVVTPAQQLMIVVPDDATLEVEASLPNRDVGFVHPDQPAEIKVEAFTFTRYGLLHGKVLDLSRDVANLDDRPAQTGQAKPSQQDSEEQRQLRQPGYIVHVTLDQTSIDTETGPQALGPGMSVTVEILTGRRRVIDYLLSPLKRYRHEGLRER